MQHSRTAGAAGIHAAAASTNFFASLLFVGGRLAVGRRRRIRVWIGGIAVAVVAFSFAAPGSEKQQQCPQNQVLDLHNISFPCREGVRPPRHTFISILRGRIHACHCDTRSGAVSKPRRDMADDPNDLPATPNGPLAPRPRLPRPRQNRGLAWVFERPLPQAVEVERQKPPPRPLAD